MLFGLDAIPLTETRTGVGHYTFELARALAQVSPANEFELAYPSSFPSIQLDEAGTPSSSFPLPANLSLARVPVNALTRHWWSMGLPLYIRRRGIELFHGTNYDVPMWGRRKAATALTIHDLSLLLYPETHEARRVRRARRRLPLMARTASVIITPTEAVRREVCEHLGVAQEKIFAVPEAPRDYFSPVSFAATEEVRRRLSVGANFMLAVGTIEPRKNLLTLVRAFADVVRHEPRIDLQLVIAGHRGWLSDALFAELDKTGVPAERVIFTGYLTDESLRALYSSCRLFVYPSIYEGFGLPPLEAMACGAPVVASRIPSLSETTGGAARLFDPHSTDDLARIIIELSQDENARAQLASAGRRHAAQFSWARTARETLEVYGEALKRQK